MVELEPLFQRLAQALDGAGGSVGGCFFDLQVRWTGGLLNRAREFLDLLLHLNERGGRFGRVERIHPLAGFLEGDDRGGKRQQVRNLVRPLAAEVKPADLVIQLVAEEQVVDPGLGAQLFKV